MEGRKKERRVGEIDGGMKRGKKEEWIKRGRKKEDGKEERMDEGR